MIAAVRGVECSTSKFPGEGLVVARIERLIGVLLPRLAVATAHPWCVVVRQSVDDIKVAGRVAE